MEDLSTGRTAANDGGRPPPNLSTGITHPWKFTNLLKLLKSGIKRLETFLL
jgi:hypothetical protein